MALAPTSRRSWRRLTRVLIFITFALVCLYCFFESQDGQSPAWTDPEVETSTSTEPKIRKPKPPKLRHEWTELWEAKSDGKLVVPIDEKGNAISKVGFTKHPLLDLIEEADKKWEATVKRQSKTLEEAVREYERRYNRPPPKGFDDWYRFATKTNVILIDEASAKINADIMPFLALSPRQVKERLSHAANRFDTFHISIEEGLASVAEAKNDVEQFRAQDLVELIQDFAEFLPDMIVHASIHDMGPNIFGDDFRAEAERLVNEKAC
ncbi:hypothetical protein FRC00_011243, partial [Tulasnella sp. 408]